MKLERFFILAFLAPGLLCVAQDPGPSVKPNSMEPSTTNAPAPAGPPLAPGTEAEAYVIGPSDIVAISVWKENTLSGNLLVRPDGMVSIPLVGDIQASGLTTLQLADQIEGRLKKYIQDPRVSVVLTQIKSKVIYTLGEFGKKGPIEMTPDMTLLQAIATAGGLSDYANAKKMYILRDDGGKHLKIRVHYKAALKGDSNLNLLLRPGDTIVAP